MNLITRICAVLAVAGILFGATPAQAAPANSVSAENHCGSVELHTQRLYGSVAVHYSFTSKVSATTGYEFEILGEQYELSYFSGAVPVKTDLSQIEVSEIKVRQSFGLSTCRIVSFVNLYV